MPTRISSSDRVMWATLAAVLVATDVSPPNWALPLTDKDRARAMGWVEAMKEDARGPYAGVMWFCNDGTMQPPKLHGCSERGGGLMYGVLDRRAELLAAMGLHVGTVLAALPTDTLIVNGAYRGRALVVEKFLERALDGWVLKNAKTYRGVRQIEDEEKAARRLLIAMAKDRDLVRTHRLMVTRLIRALPYGRQSSLADEIRAAAGLLGDADPRRFGPIRFKIHSLPEASDIAAVAAYAALPDAKTAEADALIEKMRRYYDPAHRFDRLTAVRGWIGDQALRAQIDLFTATDPAATPALIAAGAALIEAATQSIRPWQSDVQGERNLLALNAMTVVEEVWVGLAADLLHRPLTRGEALELVTLLLRSAHTLGWVSARERANLDATVTEMQAADAATYARGFDQLRRVLDWSRASLVSALWLPLARYQAVEPKSRVVIDDVIRTSIMLPLAVLLDRLGADLERLRGGHRLAGMAPQVSGLRGENPGLGVGELAVIPLGASPHPLRRDQIALLADLPPDLPPVAGILTVGSAGGLSHVSLLARNLGIPHASLSGDLAEALALHAGAPIVLGVSGGRRVVLGPLAAFSAAEQSALAEAPRPVAPSLEIPAGALDLTTRRIHALTEISEADAGIRVGPKAAELGRLKRLFPERVSDAAVIPFGAFVAHVDRAGAAGEASPLARLRAAYARARELPPEPAEQVLLQELKVFRAHILSLPWVDGFEAEVDDALKRLGKPGSFGVFVRSDTNVEDLPQFTGAGLNLTLPNRVKRAAILQAIREVWASPFSERSFRWRQAVLTNPEHVYPSVLLHRTVPSEISGVMVTADVESGDTSALTVSVSEGVAAVVDGGAPETVVLLANGGVRPIASSRTATRKVVPRPPAEGVEVTVALGRDPLLAEAEIQTLRALAAEVLAKLPLKDGLPWDIELGFAKGQLFLMQIRPLRTARAAGVHPFLRRLDEAAAPAAEKIDLTAALP